MKKIDVNYSYCVELQDKLTKLSNIYIYVCIYKYQLNIINKNKLIFDYAGLLII